MLETYFIFWGRHRRYRMRSSHDEEKRLAEVYNDGDDDNDNVSFFPSKSRR